MFNITDENNFNNQNLDNISNLLNVISIMLGYENLIENRQQTAENNIYLHNKKQSEMLLNALNKKFDELNKAIVSQNKLLNEILYILKGE